MCVLSLRFHYYYYVYVRLFLKLLSSVICVPLFVVVVFWGFKASPRCANLALKHYLLKPVQRIPQYRLLLTGTSTFS